ncbi:ABC transporter permease [Flavobacterium sp. W21_SRS_FM6]|uniref:ABC transporter permease n=1 Tax=Flavobacterium sp. W21_SRS_FM6 TaxID=3240268 RepID=UPI003F925473
MLRTLQALTGRTVLLILCAFLCSPLVIIIASLLWPDSAAWQHLINTVLSDYVFNSIVLTLGVGCGSLLLGTATAWCMTQYEFSLRQVMRWLLLLPLAIPAYIIAYTYTGILDVSGPLQSTLREAFDWQFGDYWFPEIRSLGGAILLMSLVLYPYVYILARTAFSEQSPRFKEVSALAGLSASQHFYRIVLPLARPALFTGVALAMMETLADYGTVAYFGINTFTTGIFRSWYAMGNQLLAIQLAGILCLFVLVVLVLEQHSRRRIKYYQASTVIDSRHDRIKLRGAQNITVSLICFLPVLFGFFIPVLQLVVWAMSQLDTLLSADYLTLVTSTFSLGVGVAILVVCIALLFSYQQRWANNRFSYWQIRLLSLGYALPGMVVAVGVLVVFGFADRQVNQLSHLISGEYVGLIFSGSLFAVMFAYCVRFLSIALQNTEAGFGRITPTIDDAAATLGASRLKTLVTIHSPLLRASLLSALLLVFVDVLKELPATLILRPFNFNTLAVRTYELASDERLVDAALPALTIVLVGLLPILWLTKALDNVNKGS